MPETRQPARRPGSRPTPAFRHAQDSAAPPPDLSTPDLSSLMDPSLADEAREENIQQSTSTLLEAHRHDLSRQQLVGACLRPLTAALADCCVWSTPPDDWRVGDYRTLAMVATVGDEPVSISWWSEPLEPVHARVGRGGVPDPSRDWADEAARQRLESLGYEREATTGWFSGDVPISTPGQARAMARDALTILYDVLGYRGRAPLHLTAGHGSRVESFEGYPELTASDLLRLLTLSGRDARLHDEEEGYPPCCEVREGRERYLFELDSPRPGARYGIARLVMPVHERTPVSPVAVHTINEFVRYVKMFRDSEGTLWIAMDVSFLGGVSTAWVRRTLEHWDTAREVIRHLLRRPH